MTFLILDLAGAFGISMDTRTGAFVLLLLDGMILLLLKELLRPSLLKVPLILLLFLAVMRFHKITQFSFKDMPRKRDNIAQAIIKLIKNYSQHK